MPDLISLPGLDPGVFRKYWNQWIELLLHFLSGLNRSVGKKGILIFFIPMKAGTQYYQTLMDSRLRGNDIPVALYESVEAG
jgi:hypothetical protein